MPSLADYEPLAPFTLEELVQATNSILRDREPLQVSVRTVRYYISERVLPPPQGPPKHARYRYEHLVRLVAARCLQDLGEPLNEIREKTDRLLRSGPSSAASRVQSMVDRRENLSFPLDQASFSVREAPFSSAAEIPVRKIRRVHLSDWASLDLSGDGHGDLESELRAAMEALGNLLKEK